MCLTLCVRSAHLARPRDEVLHHDPAASLRVRALGVNPLEAFIHGVHGRVVLEMVRAAGGTSPNLARQLQRSGTILLNAEVFAASSSSCSNRDRSSNNVGELMHVRHVHFWWEARCKDRGNRRHPCWLWGWAAAAQEAAPETPCSVLRVDDGFHQAAIDVRVEGNALCICLQPKQIRSGRDNKKLQTWQIKNVRSR